MDIWAQQLENALRGSSMEVSRFIPCSHWEMFSKNRWVMRVLRYIDYPRQVQNCSECHAQIQHVTDHGYSHLLPALPAGKKVVTVHDLIPLLTWKTNLFAQRETPKAKKPLLNLKSLSYIDGFDHITTVSQCTADDLVEHLGVDPLKLTVIPPIIGSHFRRASEDEIARFKSRYNLDQKKRWIMVSGCEHYKNHETALKVFKKIVDSEEQQVGLIKTGRRYPEFDKLISDLGVTDKVRQIYLQDAKDLAYLYSMVDCLLFPSLYEGFGMPVAEALACGTPAVISNRGALPEIAPDLLKVSDPMDVDSLKAEVERCFNDASWREFVKNVGPTKMQNYSSENISKRYQELYESLLVADIV